MTEDLKPSEVLSRAADLIEPEGAWTQGHGARDARGDFTSPRNPQATCWCIHGALIEACAGDFRERLCWPFVSAAVGVDDITDAYDWNDAPARTQAEVVAALRKAADLARSEGQ